MKKSLAVIFLVIGFAVLGRGQPAASPPAVNEDQSINAQAATPEVVVVPVPQDNEPATQPVVEDTEPVEVPAAPGEPRATTRPTRRRRRAFQRSSATTAPSIAATAQPRRMSADYDVLMNRSIFLKGPQETRDSGNMMAVSTPAGAAERSLVFNGVTKGDSAVAMLENTDTHEILRLRVGDEIARGKVVGISLNSLDYQVDGVIKHVGFGESLAGGSVSESASTATPGSTTQPSTNMPSARQLGESMEAYLRRRHAMGL